MGESSHGNATGKNTNERASRRAEKSKTSKNMPRKNLGILRWMMLYEGKKISEGFTVRKSPEKAKQWPKGAYL